MVGEREKTRRRIARRPFLESLAGGVAGGVIGRRGIGTARAVEQQSTEQQGTTQQGTTTTQDDRLNVAGRHPVAGAQEVVVQENHAYVAATGVREGDMGGRFGALVVVDFEDPTQPQTVARRELPSEEFPTPNTLDAKVDGDVAGLANDANFPGPGGAAFFDVSNPAKARQLSFYNANAGVHNLFIDGDLAYLVINEPEFTDSNGDGEVDQGRIFGDTGIEIVDISDPARPVRAGRWLLRDDLPKFARAGVSNSHDLFVQDGLAYVAYWDAGVIVLDVNDPSDVQVVSQFGAAPEATKQIRPFDLGGDPNYFDTVFPNRRFNALPGNAHYVQPSPDGNLVYVGAETFLNQPGGIDIWDVSNLDSPEMVGTIEAPAGGMDEGDGGGGGGGEMILDPEDPQVLRRLRTSHNFDVTADTLYTSWYGGGVRVFDVSDPSSPNEVGIYNAENSAFWTAVLAGNQIVTSDIDRGLVFLQRPGG
ncbi:LVIVD repeat-containing protein [Haladaptatus sp. NG-SE-30]